MSAEADNVRGRNSTASRRPLTPYDFTSQDQVLQAAAPSPPVPQRDLVAAPISGDNAQSALPPAGLSPAPRSVNFSLREPSLHTDRASQASTTDSLPKRDSAIARSTTNDRSTDTAVAPFRIASSPFDARASPSTPGRQHDSPEKRPLSTTPSRSGRYSIRTSVSSDSLGHSKSPRRRLRKKSLPRIAVTDAPPPPIPDTLRPTRPNLALQPASAAGTHARVTSFYGIDMDIPTGELGDLHEVERAKFSNRGSMLMDGRKITELARMTTTAEESPEEERAALAGVQNGFHEKHEPDTNGGAVEQQARLEQDEARDEVPRSPAVGLQSGRRKPSIQMLQAAIERGRVLSAEEISFSIRLRSMYEAGDEGAADWTRPVGLDQSLRSVTPETDRNFAPSIDGDSVSLKVPKNRNLAPSDSLRGADSLSRGPSTYTRASTEVAGGIEDYSDVQGRDVDRYGFINPAHAKSPTNDSASALSTSTDRPGSRLKTSNGARTGVPIKQPANRSQMRRGPSNATYRSTRSAPGTSNGLAQHSRSAATLRTTPSRMSLRSSSGGNAPGFNRKDRKTVRRAGDMLVFPLASMDWIEGASESRPERASPGATSEQTLALKRREWKREGKWQRMAVLKQQDVAQSHSPSSGPAQVKGGGMFFSFPVTDPTLIARVWKGIPDRWRATAWHAFLSASARKRGGASDAVLTAEFHSLQEQSCSDDVQIDVDVPRTINMHVMFRKRYRGGQRLLFRVLHAIALKFPDVGYVQGMASLATTLLCYFDEEMAFVMLVRLWELRGLRALYSHGFEGLMGCLTAFETEWLASGQPDVAAQLEELGIGGTAYGTRWYLTLFNMSIPFAAQLRIWDVFMLLGDESGPRTKPATSGPAGDKGFDGADMDVLHAASAALIDATRDILLGADFEEAMKVLTGWVPVKDEDLLMKVAKAEWKAKKRRAAGGK